MVQSIRAVGLAWFREEDYPALLRIFDDADKMPRLWKDWLKGAEETENRIKMSGQLTERINIDPDTFPDWCARNECSVDRHGRHKFVIAALAAKYSNQG